MAAGFYCESDVGTIQIDSTFKNVVRSQKIVISPNQWAEQSLGFSYTKFVYEVAIGEGFLFVGDTGGALVSASHAKSAANRNVFIICSTAAISLPLYVYKAQPPKASAYGMQIFSGTGELLFDALEDHLSILDVRGIAAGQDGLVVTAPNRGQIRTMAMLTVPGLSIRSFATGPNIVGSLIFSRGVIVDSARREITVGPTLQSLMPPRLDGPPVSPFSFRSACEIVIAGDYANGA